MFILLFADGVILLSSTTTGLHFQVNVLRLLLSVNLDKANIMFFRMGGHICKRGKDGCMGIKMSKLQMHTRYDIYNQALY